MAHGYWNIRAVDGIFIKACSTCRVEKPLDQFFPRKNYLDSRCYECSRIRTKKWRESLSMERKIRMAKKQQLKHDFGITPEEFSQMLLIQNGVCAICGLPETAIQFGRVVQLSVDHNHRTGKIRGLLCAKCNFGIGNFREDVEAMKKAIEYLSVHSVEAMEKVKED